MIRLIFLILVPTFFFHSFGQNINLKDISPFPIGTSVRIQPFLKDKKLVDLQKRHFNSITSGNDMKMYEIIKKEGIYYWDRIDTIVNYAKTNNQRMFGHNLIWHFSTPRWVRNKARENPAWLDKFLKEYITEYVSRYKGVIHGWDVVNEAFEASGGEYRKESIWYEIMGKEYIEKAFRYAHEVDPDATLFYNDFNIERDTSKLNSVLEMVSDFKKRGVPISGIGFQMHIRMDIPNEVIAYTLKKAADTGLQIHLSETDIIFNIHDDNKGGGVERYKELNEEMKLAQAKKYKDLVLMYRSIVPKEQQYGITFWGFNDRDTWIRRFFNMNDWPCLFDDNLNPKPAFYGFSQGLTSEL